MAQTKKKTQKRKKPIKKEPRIFGIPESKAKIVGIFAIIIIILVWFVNSSYWPWPSDAEMEKRFNEVIEECAFNEHSQSCIATKKKYGMEFEYCHYLGEIPEIGKNIPTYGVAKKADFRAGSLNYEKYENMNTSSQDGSAGSLPIKNTDENSDKLKRDGIYPYYGCVFDIDEVGKSNSEDLTKNPTTIALYGLSRPPEMVSTGTLKKCESSAKTPYNNFWSQIPNAEAIHDEYEVAFKTYNYCSQRNKLNDVYKTINKKFADYSKDKTVQLFFKAYDEWNTGPLTGCKWGDKRFDQGCGAAGEKNNEGEVYTSSIMETFIKDMKKYKTTKYFASKLVSTD